MCFLLPVFVLISVIASCHSCQLCCCVYRHRFSLPSENKHHRVFCCLSDSAVSLCRAQDSVAACGLSRFPICKPPALPPCQPGWSLLAAHQRPADVTHCRRARPLSYSQLCLKTEEHRGAAQLSWAHHGSVLREEGYCNGGLAGFNVAFRACCCVCSFVVWRGSLTLCLYFCVCMCVSNLSGCIFQPRQRCGRKAQEIPMAFVQ